MYGPQITPATALEMQGLLGRGMSIFKVANRFGVNWKSVKRVADGTHESCQWLSDGKVIVPTDDAAVPIRCACGALVQPPCLACQLGGRCPCGKPNCPPPPAPQPTETIASEGEEQQLWEPQMNADEHG